MATRSANQPPSVNTAPTASVPPASDAVSTETVLPPELLQTLVSTVTAEVAKQLSAQLSTMLPTPGPVASTDHQPVPTYMQEPSSSHSVPPPQGQQSEANTLVTGAIAAAHASISGEPQLLPTLNSNSGINSVEPTQLFHSTKGTIWNGEFIDFGSLLSNSSIAINVRFHS
jgi:hypothetical protein